MMAAIQIVIVLGLIASGSAAAFSAPHPVLTSISSGHTRYVQTALHRLRLKHNRASVSTSLSAISPSRRRSAVTRMLLTSPPDQVHIVVFTDWSAVAWPKDCGDSYQPLPLQGQPANRENDKLSQQCDELLQAEDTEDAEVLVISGPSGVGKGSIIQCLLRQLGSRVALCIRSHAPSPCSRRCGRQRLCNKL